MIYRNTTEKRFRLLSGQEDVNSNEEVPQHFFGNFTRLIGLTHFAILIGLMLFFWFQINEQFEAEVRLIESNVHSHSQRIESIIGKSRDQLDNLQMLVSDETEILARLNSTFPGQQPGHWPAFTKKEDTSTDVLQSTFHLDQVNDFDKTGNIVGTGSLQYRSPEFYADMEQTLLLNAGLRSLVFTHPNAAKARFLTAERFQLVVPWQPSAELHFSEKTYLDPIWQLGRPEVNPDREKHWAPPYFSVEKADFLLPAITPVYRGQRFVGVLSIDTSVDYLNRIYSEFPNYGGTLLLTDAFRHLLVHPPLLQDHQNRKKMPMLVDHLPDGILPLDLNQLPHNTRKVLGEHIVIAHKFTGAPWTQYFFIKKSAVWNLVFVGHGVLILAAFITVLMAMIATYFLTSVQFIKPISALLAQISKESNFRPVPIPLKPHYWHTWFVSLGHTFREAIDYLQRRKEKDCIQSLQKLLIPTVSPEHPNYKICATIESTDDPTCDFFDHFDIDEHLHAVAVGDMSNSIRSISSAVDALRIQTLLKVTATKIHREVESTVESVNIDLSLEKNQPTVALFYAVLDIQNGSFRYCNAGLPQPIRIESNGRITFLPVMGGLEIGSNQKSGYQAGEVRLKTGDIVLIYNKSIIRAVDQHSAEFSQDRLVSLLKDNPPNSAQETVDRVMQARTLFTKESPNQSDSVCMAIKFEPQDIIV